MEVGNRGGTTPPVSFQGLTKSVQDLVKRFEGGDAVTVPGVGGLTGQELLAPPAPISSFVGLPADTSFTLAGPGSLLTNPSTPQFTIAPGTTFEMPAGAAGAAPAAGAEGAAGAGSGTAAGLAGLGAGLVAAAPSIMKAAGADLSPKQQNQAQLASGLAAPAIAATPAAAALASGAGAASLGAAGAGLAFAPLALAFAAYQFYDAEQKRKAVERETGQLKEDLGGPVREVAGFLPNDAPGLYETVTNAGSTPEQIKTAYDRAKYLADLQNAYDQHIKEGGRTSVGGIPVSGYTKGLAEQLAPYNEMNQATLLLGQDALTKAGVPFDPAYQGISPVFSMFGTDSPFLQSNYYGYEPGREQATREQQATQGLTPEAIEQNIQNALGAGTLSPTTRWNPETLAGLEAAFKGQPLLEGLRRASEQYNVPIKNPYIQRALQPAAAPGGAPAGGTTPGAMGEQVDELIKRAMRGQ
jgi:hypothetical protein